MRLITPKRLKENEEFMWRSPIECSTSSSAAGEGEFIGEFAEPYSLRVIADLLGVPEEDREELIDRCGADPRRRPRQHRRENPDADAIGIPLRGVPEYIEDRRREPRDDVLTGLATATFPDGSTPEVGDVVRVATNVFSAGQETTVRLLGTALKVLAERPDIQKSLRQDRSLISNFIEEALRIESPVKGDFRLSRVRTDSGGIESRGRHGNGAQWCGESRSSPLRGSGIFDPARKNARQHLAFGRGIHSCPGAPLARAETRVASNDFSIGPPISVSPRAATGPRMTVRTNTFRRTSCGA